MSTTNRGAVVAILVAVVGLLTVVGVYLSRESGVAEKPEPAADSASTVPAVKEAGPETTTAELADEPATSSSVPNVEETDTELQEEAASYVSQIANDTGEPVRMDEAETFIGAERLLTTASSTEDAASPEQELTAENTGPDEVPVAEAAGPDDEPAAEAAGRQSVEAIQPREQVSERDETRSSAVAPPLTGEDIAVKTKSPTGEVPEAGEIAEVSEGKTLEAGEAAGEVQVELPLTEASPVTISELLEPEVDVPADAVFYVHTVQPGNDQGIWGIVHTSIIDNFAQGVAVHRGESTETYRVRIPHDADEVRPDDSSSFLGRFIYEKSLQSYVYNYETRRLGRNPDLIFPGQEIVIIGFTPEELIAVYKHFIRQQG